MEHCENQLDYLCTIAEADELPPSAVVVYIHLLNINRRLHWREWFSVANSTLANITKLGSNKTIVSAKNRLKQAGLIDFKSDGKKTTRYLLITHDSTQDSTHVTTQDSTHDTTQDSTHITTQLKRVSIHTEKSAEKKQRKKFEPPTLDEVKIFCKDRHSLVSPDAFFNYYDGTGWIDKNGNKVKNWKSKLLTWENHEKKKASPCQYDFSDSDDDENFGVREGSANYEHTSGAAG